MNEPKPETVLIPITSNNETSIPNLKNLTFAFCLSVFQEPSILPVVRESILNTLTHALCKTVKKKKQVQSLVDFLLIRAAEGDKGVLL